MCQLLERKFSEEHLLVDGIHSSMSPKKRFRGQAEVIGYFPDSAGGILLLSNLLRLRFYQTTAVPPYLQFCISRCKLPVANHGPEAGDPPSDAGSQGQ